MRAPSAHEVFGRRPRSRRGEPLTPRQVDCALGAANLTVREIARALRINKRTVYVHLAQGPRQGLGNVLIDLARRCTVPAHYAEQALRRASA